MRPVVRPAVSGPGPDTPPDTWFTFENLYRAYLDCRKGKAGKLNHLRFFANLEQELLALEAELRDRTYRPGQSIAFVVTKPKVREIFAANFRDRVVHHLLYNYMAPTFERAFIHDSYACRKGKGTHRAAQRLQDFLCRQRRQGDGRPGYYLKMDVRSFFTSIDQQVLYRLVCKRIKREEIRWLTRVIIFHDCARDIPPRVQSCSALFAQLPAHKSLFHVPRGTGLPIGNLTSQFFANVYLNELDQYIKHGLKARYYLRYVDDLVLLGDSVEALEHQKAAIATFARERLGLQMHPGKQFIRPSSDGVDFLGYVVRADYMLMRRRVAGQWRHKLESRLARLPTASQACTSPMAQRILEQTVTIFASYEAHALWANCGMLTRAMKAKYCNSSTRNQSR